MSSLCIGRIKAKTSAFYRIQRLVVPQIIAFAFMIFCVSGCVAPPRICPAIYTSDPATSLLSAQPGTYDYSGFKPTAFNTAGPYQGCTLGPAETLEAMNRSNAAILSQIPVEAHPIPGSVRIVLPDHDRLRVFGGLLGPALGNGAIATAAIDFLAETLRLQQHFMADVVTHSRLFTSATLVEQNDTAFPDAAGADYLMWFQVRSANANNAGPWAGSWQIKRASASVSSPIGIDTGTPLGVSRYLSFIKSIRLALGNPGGLAGGGPAHHVVSAGSGIVLDAQGDVLTNNHVVANCRDLRITDGNGQSTPASTVAGDAANDLALLKTGRRWQGWASFRDSHGLRPGETLVVTGYPLSGVVSSEMAVGTGSLTAVAGLHGDTRQFQFSAPIQPGNSGGPVLDENGRVVGITQSELNGMPLVAATGVLPQNVNFAIKTNTAREFLDTNQVSLDSSAGHAAMRAPEVADLARKFTVKIECLQ
jgi:S1-C subfamily serine protease